MCGAPNSASIAGPSGVRVSVRPSCHRRWWNAGDRNATLASSGPSPRRIKQPRGIRPDIDSGADLGQPARLFVDLDVEAGLQQADRGGEPADPAADDRDGCVPRCHASHHGRLPNSAPTNQETTVDEIRFGPQLRCNIPTSHFSVEIQQRRRY